MNTKTLSTASEILVNSGLNWEVNRSPIYDNLGREIPGYKALQRSDNGYCLNIASDRYVPFNNSEKLSLVDEILKTGMAKYKKAGSYKNGKKVYFRLELPEFSFSVVPGDIVNAGLDINDSFDGTSALTILPWTERLVCKNGATAQNKDYARRVYARHTVNGRRVFEINAKELLEYEVKYFETFKNKCQELARKEMNRLEIENFLLELFETDREDMSGRSRNAMNAIYSLARNGQGQTIDGVHGTAWAVYNGVTEYIDHYSTGKESARIESSAIGSGSRLRERAFALLTR